MFCNVKSNWVRETASAFNIGATKRRELFASQSSTLPICYPDLHSMPPYGFRVSRTVSAFPATPFVPVLRGHRKLPKLCPRCSHIYFGSLPCLFKLCSIPPTTRVHSRTFVNSTAKRALVTYSRMVMPLTNFPTLLYHSRTKIKLIPKWPCQRRTKFFWLFHSGTDFHSNDFLLEEVNLPKHKLT